MTVTLERPRERTARHLDLSVPVLVLLALFLCVLVLLPLGWLAWYSITDKDGVLTPGNFVRLARDPTFVGPYLTALEIATGVALAACAAALPLAWLVARTDLPLRRLIRINGLVCERDDLFNGLHIYDRSVLEKENQANGPAGFAWRS